jgi:hypothetical protein
VVGVSGKQRDTLSLISKFACSRRCNAPAPATSGHLWGQCNVGPRPSSSDGQTRPTLVSRVSRTLATWAFAQPALNTSTHSALRRCRGVADGVDLTVRSKKEVVVCASLTNDRQQLSLADDVHNDPGASMTILLQKYQASALIVGRSMFRVVQPSTYAGRRCIRLGKMHRWEGLYGGPIPTK